MPKAKNKLVDEAFALYQKGLKLKEIAGKLEIPEGTVRRWKYTYKWECERSEKSNKKKASVRKKGGQLNNNNAVGNHGGAPVKNDNAVQHGIFQKYLPKESLEIIELMNEKTPLDLIWDAIQIQYAAIIRSQQIMYVKDIKDKTTTKIEDKTGNVCGERWEVQQAWDKQTNFLKAQSTAIATLKNMLKDYLELEGASKEDSKKQVTDWKAAIIEIAKRRSEKDGGTN